MKVYIGTKIIQAEPMEKAQFSMHIRALDGVVIDSTGHSENGYKVVYSDGYVSWSPKDVFEKAYREVTQEESTLVKSGD